MSSPDHKNPSRLSKSSYLSPYTRSGAPPHPTAQHDPYAPLRARALETLESMGYDPRTMVERGVVWAEDQDPFGHVMHAQYMHFLGHCFFRVMEGYEEWLSPEEYDDMVTGKGCIPVVRSHELKIKRQVKYPDSLIAAFREDGIEPTRNQGTTSLFSLQQQCIVAESKGAVTYIDAKTGRPVDIRTLGGGWPKVFEGFTERAAKAKAMKEDWEREQNVKSKM